jgi:hypothetical protein
MAVNENPIAELHEAVAGNPVKAAGAVAVIDTGVNGVANVTESVSMIGDNTADENGHGTKMAQLIAEQNPDVSILSIKALGADGTGDVSAVYAAIQYAIDKKVSVINLSMSAMGTAENAALTSVIDSAVKAGIAVVGAAGNKGMNVRFFVPGNIESAYIIGAADENGARIATSNYGATVDFNVVADSTSEAAAKFSGYYTLNGAVADKKLVFPTDYVKNTTIDYNGPLISHQISFYDYEKTQDDLVWISQKQMKTALDDDYFTTWIGFQADSDAVKDLNVYVNFMSIGNEKNITDECIVDLKNMQVKIPVAYKDAAITVRWFMPNASYQYCYDTDENYMVSNTPEKFKVSWKIMHDDGSVEAVVPALHRLPRDAVVQGQAHIVQVELCQKQHGVADMLRVVGAAQRLQLGVVVRAHHQFGAVGVAGRDAREGRRADGDGQRVVADLCPLRHRQMGAHRAQHIAQQVRGHHAGAAAAEVHGPDLVTVQFSLIGEHLPLEGVHIGVFFRIGAHRVEVREVVFRADAVRDVQVKHERFCHGDAPCRFL